MDLKLLLLLTFSHSAFGSPGTDLAQIVQTSVTDTGDICILHDTFNFIWADLLDDFIANLSENFAINRLNWIGYSHRKCAFHLIVLDSSLGPVEFNRMVHEYLEASFWNRYGMFVFVVVEDGRVDLRIFELYGQFVASLGITKSVLVFVTKNGNLAVIMGYKWFKGSSFFVDGLDDLSEFFRRDTPKDAFGSVFKALVFNNEPFLFVILPETVLGIEATIIQEFCKHVNATLDIRIGTVLSYAKVSHSFEDDFVSIVNTMNYNQKFSELEFTYSQSGLCLLVPEKMVGSMLYHLLRPFQMSLFILVLLGVILLPALSFSLPSQFPRGIFNQLFFGSVISDYKMLPIERFTLLSLSIILFLLCESYLAKLFQFLFNYQYEPHLKSIEELLADATIYSHTPFFITFLNATYPQPKRRFELLPAIDRFTHPENSKILCTLCHFAQGFVQSRQNLDALSGFLRHYVLPARIPLAINAFTHSKRQPFSAGFAHLYGALQQAGILDHWFEQYKKTWLAPAVVGELQVVKFGHLFSLWKLLAVGYGLAGVVWGVEIGVKFVMRKMGFADC